MTADGTVRKNAAGASSSEQTLPLPSKLIRSWTPVTARLLSKGGPNAWNVLDHAMEAVDEDGLDFVAHLNKELESEGLLQELKPARTNAEVAAGIDLSSSSSQNNTNIRGDCSLFIERSRRERNDWTQTHPVLHTLIQSVEETVLHHLQDSLELDRTLTSVQLAEYPGNGVSGYIRHCDRGGATCHDNAELAQKGKSNKSERIITVIYYLTPNDWNHDRDGGSLRLYLDDKDHHYDVVPFRNRMVVFRSDSVEHQVMPSLRRPRRAITIWLYGTLKGQDENRRVEKNALEEVHDIKTGSAAPPPLCISSPGISHQDQASIFVSIAAYRDSETGPTIRHLMATARHPDRVFVGLVLQVAPNDAYDQQEVVARLPTTEPWYDSHVRCLTLDARHATGPCPARALCQMLHRGEDYVLQIDSHMRFRANWDVYLIEQLSQCPGGGGSSSSNNKNVLTAYPVGYQLPNDIPNETRGTLLIPDKFGSDGMLRQRGRFFCTTPDRPVRCQLYAAGFNFCSASVLQDCPYDPSLRHLFFGEEVSMAVRLYTAGYDMYAPCQSVCYHLWSRTHRPADYVTFASTDNNNKGDDERKKRAQREQSLAVVLKQVAGRGPGLGDERTAAAWAAELGVHVAERTVRFRAPECVVKIGIVEGNEGNAYFAPNEWEAQMSSLEGTNAKSLVLGFLQGS
jgi:[Skp1-protein]-hydroxyproline N-acetylglucosaminyltransferase